MGGGAGQWKRHHLCSVFVHLNAIPPPSLSRGKAQPGFWLQMPQLQGCGLERSEKATVHSSRLEELLRWEEDAILS